MAQARLDSGEMKDFLKHVIKNNRFIQNKGIKPVATEVIGESGLGKTTVVTQVAEETGLQVVKINLAQIEELGDLVGYPVKQFELCKHGEVETPMMEEPKEPQYKMQKITLPNGKTVMKKVKIESPEKTNTTMAKTSNCIWVDEVAVTQYINRGFDFTGKKRMAYAPPSWIADITGGGILLVDDWTRADPRFIQAMMEVCDRQEYISWKLPKDWHIILTANPDNGEYQVQSLDTAQQTRFVSLEMKWSEDRWAEWAEQIGMDGRCINFVLMNPEIVNAKVNPRSITTFFNCISSFDNFANQLPMIQMIGEGSVGPEVSTLFSMFINNNLDKLITPKEMLLGKTDKEIENKLHEAITPNGDYRADIASVLCTRLTNYALRYASENSIKPETIKRLEFLIEANIFTDDLKYDIVKKLIANNKQKFQKLIMSKNIQAIVTK